MAQTREVIAYDHPSNVGGTFTVSVVKAIDETFAEVRVWYGRPSPTGWIPWREWDGYIFKAKRSDLTNERKNAALSGLVTPPRIREPYAAS